MRPIGPDKTLSQMIAAGEIDALHTARAPSTFYSKPDAVKRLFPNYVEVEREYYRRTKIFPIMHVVAIRRELYEANRWIAMSLYKAFVEAQRRAYRSLRETAAHKAMLPWLVAHVEDAVREMGEDWWPYGFHGNRHVLDTFLRYHHEQGLSQRRLAARGDVRAGDPGGVQDLARWQAPTASCSPPSWAGRSYIRARRCCKTTGSASTVWRKPAFRWR